MVRATEINVNFALPDTSHFLRLNMGSNGWTNGGLSQYYDDLDVSYRRMDHWNNLYNPIRRCPDGRLWYDYWALDHAIYDGTGGFRFKPYPAVDYSPACFTTEFLRNPMHFVPEGFHAQLTPAGTLILWGKEEHYGAYAATGMYEVDRKGVVVWKADYGPNFVVTRSNRLLVNRDDGTYLVLDAARRKVALGQGVAVEEVAGKSLLVKQGNKVKLVGLDGAVEKTWAAEMPGPVAWSKHGLLEVTENELLLHADAGTKSLFKSAVKFNGTYLGTHLAINDAGRLFFTYSTYPGKWVYGAVAFDENANVLWKRDDFQTDAVRGSLVTTAGDFIMPTVGAMDVTCFDSAGEVKWKASNSGSLFNQLLSSPGMETFMLQAYNDTVTEYDVRTGKIVWQYGNVGDQSDWITTPPKDLAGWEESIYHYLKHYNKDLGLGWDRWELWNEPGTNGYFWKGDYIQYGKLAQATMRGVERGDPAIHMDFYAGDWPPLIQWLAAHKVRFDGMTYHGYDVAVPNNDISAMKAHQAGEFRWLLKSSFPTATPTLGDSEWNLHPGNGEDLSKRYENGYYLAPFQSELVKVKAENGVTFSSQFSMRSDIRFPSGWVYVTDLEVAGHKPPAGGANKVISPGYNAAKLWSMLPKQKASLTNDFRLQMVKGTSHRVNAIAAADAQRGEYGVLVWNFSNQSQGAKDETVTLKLQFPAGAGTMTMRHYTIDADHSTYTAGWNKQWLEAVESGKQNADGAVSVALKKDSLHGLFFTKGPLQAVAKAPVTVQVNQPVRFDGSGSSGMPANYRWDFDAADGVDFPPPDDGSPSPAHGYGATPILAHGYAKPGRYTVTLQVSADGYGKETSTAATTVVVTADKSAPPAPAGLTANSEATDREVYLEWDAPNSAAFPDVIGYYVFRKEGGGAWRQITSAPLQATAFVDNGLVFGRSYTYCVMAVDASGNASPPSAQVTAAVQQTTRRPKTPLAVQAVIPGGDLVRLTWDNPSLADAARVAGFNVYRRVVDSGEFLKVTPQPTFYKMYYDDIRNPGLAGKYEYAVTAVDAFGNESVQSAPARATAQPAK
jgi:hypothetical protein